MKKALAIGAGAALSLTAGHAFAQSSVTLYGIIDTGITYTSNQAGGSSFAEHSGKLGGSRWGLKGAEDLGNGLQAVFQLESGYSVANGTAGQGNRAFGRTAVVGVHQNGVGTLTLGRQVDSLADLVAPYFGSGIWTPATHIADNDNLNQTYRINNSVKFLSDSYSGFRVAGIYGFSNSTNFAANRTWGLSAQYAMGPLSFGGGYMQENQPNTGTVGSVGASGTVSGTTDVNSTNFAMTGTTQNVKIMAGGAGYTFGPFIAGIGYSRANYQYTSGSRDFNNIDGNLRYKLTPAISLLADYTYTNAISNSVNGVGSASAHWHTGSLGADYAFSKRTHFYVAAEYSKASGRMQASNTVVAGTAAPIAQAAVAGGNGTSRGDSQVAVSIGIRHNF